MTSHYLDFHVRADPDFPAPMLMGALFSKMHRRFVALDMDRVGVSFPAHRLKPRDIGGHLRLHGTSIDLETVMDTSWLGGMQAHVQRSEIEVAPAGATLCTVSRRQFRTNADRLRRRRIKRHGESEATAHERIPDTVEQRVPLPFVQVRSTSTGQRFALFIEHVKNPTAAHPGTFNSYGLSCTSAVPWF